MSDSDLKHKEDADRRLALIKWIKEHLKGDDWYGQSTLQERIEQELLTE